MKYIPIQNLDDKKMDLISKIHDYIKIPENKKILMKNLRKWGIICASLDTIIDTQDAISEYKKKEYGQCHYLPIYGLLQALFLQMNSLNSMSKALFEKWIHYEKYPGLKKLRVIRNNISGHPTDRLTEMDASFTINRNSIKHGHLKYSEYKSKKWIYNKPINIIKLIDTHDKETCKILEEMIKNI